MRSQSQEVEVKYIRAILKHGLDNFSLTILEYCDPDKLLKREGDFIKLLKPEYNIIQDPTLPPMFGLAKQPHSEETLKKMIGRTHSAETLKKMSDIQKAVDRTGENNPMYGRIGENHPRFGISKPEGAGRPDQKIEVFDLNTNESTTYDSIRAAARALNIQKATIRNFCFRNQQKPYKGRYIFAFKKL